ncbi:MAG: DUF1801 domain-containing protein [Candidatus Promineifilaceae bacterium]|nr:DUF1801 domain-containing protein [Anaerolineaceae bacterium]
MKAQTVEQLLSLLDHPDINLINLVRETVKQAAPELVEGVKWNAPSYALNSNDIITFNFRNYGSVSLIFHTGPKGKDTKTGQHLFEESTGLVEWVADKRFVLKVVDGRFLQTHSAHITQLIQTWTAYAANNFEPTI